MLFLFVCSMNQVHFFCKTNLVSLIQTNRISTFLFFFLLNFYGATRAYVYHNSFNEFSQAQNVHSREIIRSVRKLG